MTTSALKPILVVEDNPRDLEMTLAALKKCKLSNGIIVARDGEEALRMLSLRDPESGWPTQLPAVVLLELDLPKIDGLEVLERVKSNPAIRHVPIVMFTASCSQRHARTTTSHSAMSWARMRSLLSPWISKLYPRRSVV
ncbi:response regulator [Azospirillum sp. Marseille-Q6669]